MKAFFRALAAAFTRQSSAQSFAGVMILAFGLYTGYTIPQPSMIGALRWITYLNVSLTSRTRVFMLIIHYTAAEIWLRIHSDQ
jgi:ABC-type multidrug transport system permease subunit